MENPLASTAEALQSHIADQLQQARSTVGLDGNTPTIISKDELAAAKSPEDVINTILKARGISRKMRRSIIANNRKPRKKARG